MTLLALAPAPVMAQGSFSDFESVGRLEDERREPSKLRVGPGHEFEPSIVYKLFGVTTPHIFGSTAAGWTDNLLREDHDAPGVRLRREGFGRFEGGIRLDTELRDHRLELGYRSIVYEYWNTGRFDTLEHEAKGRVDLYWTDFEAHLDGFWERRSYPDSIQLRGIIELEVFGSRAWAEGRFGRFGIRGGGSSFRFDYVDGALSGLDSWNHGGDVQFYWRITPKLRALVEYNLIAVRYDDRRQGSPNDYDLHQVRAGVDGALTPKLFASLKVGAGIQDVRIVPGRDDREFKDWTAEASVQYELFPRTTLLLAYRHVMEPSTSTNYLETDDVLLRLTQLLLDEKLSVAPFVAYTRSKVRPGERLNRFRTGARVVYQIRDWLSVVADYEFKDLISSAGTSEDYRAHVFTLALGAGM